MKVWVIMGNDYPCALRLTKRAADAYVARRKAKDKADREHHKVAYPRIYWRHYEFEVTRRGNKK